MIFFNKNIPELHTDVSEYRPFIKNEWFRNHYMWFAYSLMIVLYLSGVVLGRFQVGNLLTRLLMWVVVYLIHESLHIITVYNKGDIYVSHSGIYLWLTPDVVLSKKRFWLFMTLPLIVLSLMTGAVSIFVADTIGDYLRFIAWVNAIIAGSDIINSILIVLKPGGSIFYRGHYK